VPPADELRISVRLVPRAGADRIDGVDGPDTGVLRCRVAAPPVGGAANAALLRLLARELDLPPGAVRLVSGDRSRRKVVAVPGDRRALVGRRWPGLI
jgi:uncharacterized protein YggU (UPF0235/DUF167 family)